MKDLISGQFAKLPRQLSSRFEEFKETTVLNINAISQLYMKYKDEPVVSSSRPMAEPKARGSLTGCVVKQANLDQWDAYLGVARTLVVSPLKTRGREVATAEDMAVLLLVLEACTNDMNQTAPCQRPASGRTGDPPRERRRQASLVPEAVHGAAEPFVQAGVHRLGGPSLRPGSPEPDGDRPGGQVEAAEALMEKLATRSWGWVRRALSLRK